MAQINHLRTHPSVAAGLAKGQLRLHGWFFAIETGDILTYDAALGRFVPIRDDPATARPPEEAPPQRIVAPEFAVSPSPATA